MHFSCQGGAEAPAEVAGGTDRAGDIVPQILLAQRLAVLLDRTLRLAVHQAQQVFQTVRFPAPSVEQVGCSSV